jgi:hypothetical protein
MKTYKYEHMPALLQKEAFLKAGWNRLAQRNRI